MFEDPLKKTRCILIAATVILLATCSVAFSTPTLSNVADPDLINPVNINAGNTRFLRFIGGKNLDDDSDKEERASEKVANILTMWTKKTTALDKLKDGRKKLAGYNTLNNKMFKSIKEAGETPQSLYKKFGIRGKIRKVDEDALLNDGNFMLWRKFSEWWGKSATNKA